MAFQSTERAQGTNLTAQSRLGGAANPVAQVRQPQWPLEVSPEDEATEWSGQQ
jgi:hypothetical protein